MSYITAPFKVFGFAFKTLTTTIMTLIIVVLLMVNATMLFWSVGAVAISGAVSAVTGVSTVVTVIKDQRTATKKAVGDVTERIAERTARGALRNLVSIPAEAVPFFGIAAVVGVTTWELRDACETMKEMNELNRIMGNDVPVAEDTVCGIKPPTSEGVWEIVRNSPDDAWNKLKELGLDIPSWSDVEEWAKSEWKPGWLKWPTWLK